jgi:hypothetical protein
MPRDWIEGDHVRVLGTARGPFAGCPHNFLGRQFASAQAPEHSVFSLFLHFDSPLGNFGSSRDPNSFYFDFAPDSRDSHITRERFK